MPKKCSTKISIFEKKYSRPQRLQLNQHQLNTTQQIQNFIKCTLLKNKHIKIKCELHKNAFHRN